MNAMDRDPQYIAETLKFLRKAHGLKQANLADLAGLTTRTIEKIESGRHRPEEQTLRSLARVLGIDIHFFEKPTAQQQVRELRAIEDAIRKTVIAPVRAIRAPGDFLDCYDEWHGCYHDMSAVESEEAMDVAASLSDWINDLDGIWGLCSTAQRVDYARSFADLCQRLDVLGYRCDMGQFRQRQRQPGKPDLVFRVGLLSFRPKGDGDGERYAMVRLQDGWETLEEDRAPMPDASTALGE